jgi:hypothetical protein
MMSQRLRSVAALGAGSLVTAATTAIVCGGLGIAVGSCGSDAGAPCHAQSTAIAASGLASLPDARLDRVGGGFVLLGLSADQLLWASLTVDGSLGAVHSVAVPAHRGTPWFAVTGGAPGAPTAQIVVAYLAAEASAASPVWFPLMTFTAPLDGGPASAPTRVGSLPDPTSVAVEAAMVSAVSGQRAGFVWGIRGAAARIEAAILDAKGLPLFASDQSVTPGQGFGQPIAIAADDFDCLGFTPGKGDLTTIYVDRSGTPPAPTAVISELDATTGGASSVRVPLDKAPTGCVRSAPTAVGGYVLAWHTVEGTYTGEYIPGLAGSGFRSALLAADVEFSDGAPVAVGLGDVGGSTSMLAGSFAVVLQRPGGLEGWAFGLANHAQGGALHLPDLSGPTSAGQPGPASVSPVGTSLFATYAVPAPPAIAAAAPGQRLLVRVTCP